MNFDFTPIINVIMEILTSWPVAMTIIFVQLFKIYDKKNNHKHKKLYPLIALVAGLIIGYVSIGNPFDWWVGVQTGIKTCGGAALSWTIKEALGIPFPGDRSQKGK